MNARTRLSTLAPAPERQRPLTLVTAPGGVPRGESGLVGREPELRALREFLDEGAARGAARVLCGLAGTGKSALLEATVQAALASGMRVLRCAGSRDGDPPGLSGLRRLVWPVLAGTHRPSAGGRFDAVRRVLADGGPVPGGQSWLSFAVLGLLESAGGAGQPLLIAVDDWDALDAPSRDALTFVARRAEGRPMAVLLAARPHRTPPSPLAGLPELPLGPLAPIRSAELLATRRPGLDAQAVRELLAAAAGNPLALLELPARSEEPVPWMPASSDRLAAALASGVRLMPRATRSLLLVAALHPAGDLPLLLAAASRIAGAELSFTALEPAERAGLVVPDGTRLRFGHPATAGAVVHGTGRRCRRAAHAALAAVLPPGSVQALWHRSEAAEGCDPALAARLEAVHGHALERDEPPMAVRLLRRAADLYPAPADRGRCALRAAQLAHGLGLERTARTMARRALRERLNPLGTLCAKGLAGAGDGRRPAADPSAWPVPAGAAEQEDALELVRITAAGVAGDDERAGALLAFLDGMPDRSADPRLLLAMATAAPVRRAATVLAGVAAVRCLADLPVRDLERLGEAALMAGDAQTALDLCRRAERNHRLHDRPDRLPRVLLRQGMAHLALGDRGQGGDAFRRCAELAEAYGHAPHAAAARLLEGLVGALRTGGAVRPGSAHELAAARRSVRSIDAVLAVGTACALAEAGEAAAAWPALSSLLADPRTRATALFALVPFVEAAEAANASGEALAALDGLEAEPGSRCPPVVAARLAVARAVLADDEDTQALPERAFPEVLSRSPALAAALRLARGRRLRRLRQVTDSRAALRQAAAGFALLGSAARAARITAELRASGERTGGGGPGMARAGAARDLLSPQELRIAELAGQGLSNRDIGERLGLSPRTIGAYLYRVFPRLGVTSRAQLAEALRDPHPA
ncbi:helix-turn-helix transcriptional regulator [Streptomyces achromogenes]|uniref:helix-turn-helix transcriptional regulator n=1 Tax=Streptomyces achromogenes TaxID=67255 RepID=UPI0036A2CFFC